MVNKEPDMQKLTKAQEQQLVEILLEDCGSGMEFDDFSDALLGLMEDIAGFETASQSSIDKLVQQLWSKYNVQ